MAEISTDEGLIRVAKTCLNLEKFKKGEGGFPCMGMCGHVFPEDTEFIGQWVKCPKCGWVN